MGTQFRVDFQALDRAASGVNGTLDEISVQKVSDIPHDPSAIGHGKLASTLSDFLSRWQRGVDNLAKDGQEIATRLTANVTAYRKADKGVQDQFIGVVQGTGTDPGVK
ncbi:hypothetical protein P3T37_004133 [Kitasatospora sp. MAA4]|uniref:hypothetical protein n=1 Tax=Kitasatospora sp. MAA4 TaxID=3035093 RepID=UPI002474ECBE|nr:hypothetical protein [Kitasatospora sp. MAA4]MDH6134729.1 hypothetical protein [Kitasatospora sp. MAA4]